MVNELNVLEDKIVQVASLCRALRTENGSLRQRLAMIEAEKRELAERMETARHRIEQLAQRLPKTDT
jgi:cell division protein ZapB